MPALPTSLTLGSLRVDVPVVLAPMAGITNAAYRRLCAEQGAGLYVCEMITSRGLVEGDQHTRDMLVFDELETVRSVQLYGTDPVHVGKAAEILCAEYGVAGLLGHGRLGRDRRAGRARRHPGARQRRHLGGRRRPADGRADRCGRRRR